VSEDGFMIRPLAPVAGISLLLAACGGEWPGGGAGPAAPANRAAAAPAGKAEPLPDVVRVRLETGQGPILLALDVKRAPVTAGNFLRYVEEGRFDGTSFYRAAPTKTAPERGFIQGGIRRDFARMLPPIAHEPTSLTGLRHETGTISMARTEIGAMGEFFITTAAMPNMDAKGDKDGYAAFGRVVEGMDTVRRILGAPTVPGAGRGAMKGQMIAEPVPIVSARRVE